MDFRQRRPARRLALRPARQLALGLVRQLAQVQRSALVPALLSALLLARRWVRPPPARRWVRRRVPRHTRPATV
jgi:hypothetical protein